MKLLFLYINLSFLLSLEYAIIYEDNLYDSANSIANLYSSEVQNQFRLDAEIFSKTYIETFSGETITEKLKNFILDLKEDHSELNYILILGDENSFPPIYLNEVPSFDSDCAWIIMGSRYSAYDEMEWIDRLKDSIHKAIESNIPVLGICFGHQILCSALGATVSDNPKGWEVGSSEVSLSEKGKSSPLFKGFSKDFYVYQSHHDVVSNLPENVDLLCSNQFGVQSISFSDFVFGVQFHPEFSYDVMNAYFDARTKKIENSNFKVVNQNEGSKVINNFINILSKES